MGERLSPLVTGLVLRQKSNGRAVYDAAAKRALVEAALRPGVSVARLALDHAVNANLLRKWIRLYEAQQAAKVPALLPVVATAEPPRALQTHRAPTDAVIEIVVGAATVRLRGAVDAVQLRTVMDCLAHHE